MARRKRKTDEEAKPTNDGNSPSENGKEETTSKSRKLNSKPFPDDKPDETVEQQEDTSDAIGRCAADLKPEAVKWLMKPWVPVGMLSLLVGEPNVGKSTFLSWLTAQAERVLIFPGFEESPTITTLPRLLENGADPRNIRFMDTRSWIFPRDKELLIRIIREYQAKLVTFDPLDSYKPNDVHEKDAEGVRKYLESLASIGAETGTAIVGVRHPGKEKGNLVRGSGQWRAVPRSIIVLKNEGGITKRYLIIQEKPQLGQGESSRYYTLEGEKGKPPRFVLGATVDSGADELTRAADGETGRSKLLEACELIRHMFDVHTTPTVQDVVKEARCLGIGLNTLDEAKQLLKVRSRPQGKGGDWVLKRLLPEWPEFLKKRHK